MSTKRTTLCAALTAAVATFAVARDAHATGFAELGEDFMDLPMLTYSSGMYARLAFSVAVHMEPDILIVDEALSTGDARFKEKSFARMKELCSQARTILLVSHALGTVTELCTDAVWLDHGQVVDRGPAGDVVKAYKRFLKVGPTAAVADEDL